jgi:hypothetical protein
MKRNESKQVHRRLQLARETLRKLTTVDLAMVRGRGATTADGCPQEDTSVQGKCTDASFCAICATSDPM